MPDPNKAEKLKVNDHDYDRDPAQMVISLSCQFGMATAGEHADFKVGATTSVELGGQNYNLNGERDIVKVDGAEKIDNFIAIEPLRIDWAEGANLSGTATVTTTAFLTGPSGKVTGSEVKASQEVQLIGSDVPPGDNIP